MSGSGGLQQAQAEAEETTISAVIIRADGTKEDLGVISYWHKDPFMRWWYNFKQTLKGLLTK